MVIVSLPACFTRLLFLVFLWNLQSLQRTYKGTGPWIWLEVDTVFGGLKKKPVNFEWSFWMKWGKQKLVWLLLGHMAVSQMASLLARKIPNLKKKRSVLGNLPCINKTPPKTDLEVNLGQIFDPYRFMEVKKLQDKKQQKFLGKRDQNMRLSKVPCG